MSVNRYEFEDYGTNEDDGRYVTYEDYAALEAQCVALAAESAGLKSKGRELLGEACAVYAKLNKLIDPAIGDFIDGQTLHEFQFLLDCETPATDAFLAEVRAQGVEMFGQWLRDSADIFDKNSRHDWADQNRVSADKAGEFASQIRKGVQS